MIRNLEQEYYMGIIRPPKFVQKILFSKRTAVTEDAS